MGHRVVRNAVKIQNRVGHSLVGGGGLGPLAAGGSDQELLLFVGEEEEKLVLQDRAADGESIVLISCLRFDRGGEGIGALKGLVVVEVVDAAMNLVGARLDGEVGGAGGVAAKTCRPRGFKGEVLDRVDRED